MDESDVSKRMDEVLDLVGGDVASIRTGQANPNIIQDLEVLVYKGAQKLKIQELATLSVEDPQTIVLDPWDKSIISEIQKGIDQANLNLATSVDGEVIRVSFPVLTTEDREKYVKLLSTKLEGGRVMIRQIRADFMRQIKEAFEKKEISEDEKFRLEKRLQEITDEKIEKINELGEAKKKELTRI